jgi:hypothetical protein
MTRGKGIYDDETKEAESSKAEAAEIDTEKDTPDVDKDADEPTA